MVRTSNLEYWEQVVLDQANSGLTQTKWCEQNAVKIHKFRYWKSKLKQYKCSNQKSSSPTWTLLTTSPTTSPVESSESKSGKIDIQVGKVKITLQNSVDQNFLSDVLEVLMHYVQ